MPQMQRHHLLPCQLLTMHCFADLFSALGEAHRRFDDFRTNGLLLPATGAAASRSGMPLHRGPHRHYNALVVERVGQIEAGWRRTASGNPAQAQVQAMMRLELLQRGLRRRLLEQGPNRMVLNRKDPFRADLDFSSLDAMVDRLWVATGTVPVSGGLLEDG